MSVSPERLRRLGAAAWAAEKAHKDAMAARNREIIAADDEGWTLQEISDAVGLAIPTVHHIVIAPRPS